MRAALRTVGLTKYYGQVVGLESLSLEVPDGSVFGFLGPNGAGKTTTIRLLLDLVRPTSGHAWIGELDCQKQGVEARRRIGYLPGELPVYPEVTGSQFLQLLATLGQRPVSPAYLSALLRRFDVSDLDLRRRMRVYSHGMKRKLGIVQALMAEPPVVILDEPTAGLDPLMIEAFAQTLNDLKQRGGTTVFLSSHVLSEVEKTCDAIGLVRRGRLAAVHTLADLRKQMPRRVTLQFSATVNGMPPLPEGATLVSRTAHDCTLDVHGPLGPVLHALRELSVLDLRLEPLGFEQYVLSLYADGGNTS
jgi:ABC-2 type transport system ATP-binding protein